MDVEEDDKPDDGVETLWQKALETWNDDKVHGALLQYALRTENLPNVAGKYRALKDDPEKGERAKKQLDAIVLAATQLMLASKSGATNKTPTWMNTVAAVVCLLLLLFLAYAMSRRH